MVARTIDLSPAVVDLWYVPGDDVVLSLAWTDDDGTDTDFTGYTFESKVLYADDDSVLLSVAVGTPVGNDFTLTITDGQTTAMGAETRRLKWYLKWTVGGATRTVFEGSVRKRE